MKTYLEAFEVQLLENQAETMRDRILIRILFHLGCRVTEAIGQAAEDIDLEQGLVTIQHLKTRLRLSCSNCGSALGRTHVYCPGCGSSIKDAVTKELEHRRQRVLPIDSETLRLLKEFIDSGGPVLRNGRHLIFGISRHRAWQIVTRCAGKAGLPKLTNPDTGKVHYISPHRLRDSFAVNAMKVNDTGDGLRMLQEHMGHASFNTTAKYRKISGQEHRNWYDSLWNKGK
ncbi:MAG: tyrosine-type recombinase/integrase [Chloroflexota bacterium]